VTRVASLPPGLSPEQLLVDRAAAEAGNNCSGGELGLGLPAHEGLAARAQVEDPRGGGRLIKAWGPGLGVRAMQRRRAEVGLAVAAAAQSSPGRGRRGGGDDGWAPSVSHSRRRRCWAGGG
jgi:hypothetical protein